MKRLLIALTGLTLSASALAADADAQENVYAGQLCHLVSSEQKTGDMESYTAKLKAQMAASQSPSAMNKTEFDEEIDQYRAYRYADCAAARRRRRIKKQAGITGLFYI